MNEAADRPQRWGQEGNRWVNTLPTPEELGVWFTDNVFVEEGLLHSDYVGGVVLIPAVEKSKVVTGYEGVKVRTEEAENLVYTPYIRVETRLKYFHDLCELKKWTGFIDPAEIAKSDQAMPPGFFRRVVATGEKREARYVGCSKQVVIYEAGSVQHVVVTADKRTGEQKVVRIGTLLREAPAGTKTVPTVKPGRNDTVYADDNAVMKAETGAIGRALGMAGMLVIPGSGIATAEDVQEARAAEAAGPSPDQAELPAEPGIALSVDSKPPPDTDEKLREDIIRVLSAMEEEFPDLAKSFKAWAKEKKYGRLSETVSPQLRGMHRRITTQYNEATQKREQEKAAVSGGEGDTAAVKE